MNGRSIKINRVPATIAAIAICLIIFYCFINPASNGNKPSIYGMLRNQNKVNLRVLLIAAIQAAQRGGLEVLDVARTRILGEKSKGKTDEGVNDPFTAADGRSHCIMKQGLYRLFPRIKIFSEEDNESCKNLNTFDLDPTVLHATAQIEDEVVDVSDVTVWIDPLDATKEFTEKLYEYVTTMVCVAVKGVPIIGVIHSPFNGLTAWAWVDHSLSEHLAALHDQDADKSIPIITVSRSHAGDVKDLVRNVFGEKSHILTAAGSGYKVLQVVANNATAYLHSTKIKKWDICAGDAVLRALGGKMTTLENNLIDYSNNGSPVNTQGILATIAYHNQYIEKLMTYLNKHNSR